MFGDNAQDDHTQAKTNDPASAPGAIGQPFTMDPSAPTADTASTEPASAPVADITPAAATAAEEAQSSGDAPDSTAPMPELTATSADDASSDDTTAPAPASDELPDEPSTDSNSGDSGDLADLKQQALQQLSPLVDHLDQTPEEKFKTTMMMIQASDDQSLVKTAYDAAQQITDEKTKAQALLDIVNEINYFTNQKDSSN